MELCLWSNGFNSAFSSLLVGLGVDELSVSPKEAPLVKDVIRKLYYTDAIELAQRSLISESAMKLKNIVLK